MRRPLPTTARRVAWSAWTLCLAFNGVDALLVVLSGRDTALAVTFAVVSQLFSTFGAVITSQRPQHPMGWLFLGTGGLLAVGNAANGYAPYAQITRHGDLPGGSVAGWFLAWTTPPSFLAIALVFLLFPAGRLPSARWRPFAWGYAATIAVGAVAVAVAPGDLFALEGIGNPFGIDTPFLAGSWELMR